MHENKVNTRIPFIQTPRITIQELAGRFCLKTFDEYGHQKSYKFLFLIFDKMLSANHQNDHFYPSCIKKLTS
jgi:hypothetical protein